MSLTNWREPQGNDLARSIPTGETEEDTQADARICDNAFEENHAPAVMRF